MSNQPDGASEGGADGRAENLRPADRAEGTGPARAFGGRRLALAVAALGLTATASLGALGVVLAERSALTGRIAALEADVNVDLAQREAAHAAELAALRAEAEAEAEALRAERDAVETEAAVLRMRLAGLAADLTDRQTRLMDAAETEAELTLALEALRAKLRDAVTERDATELRRTALEQELAEIRRGAAAANAAEAEWTAALAALSVALEDVTRDRDAAERARRAAAGELAAAAQREARAREARERLYDQLADAVEAGLGGLEGALRRAGVNPDKLVDQLKRDYSGVGGPFIPADSAAAPEAAGVDGERIAALMGGLERASLLQVAAAKLPLANPVRGAFRYTSGFGVRRDPKNGRMRMHAGADFAGPVGTPIHAPADGVISFAGWQSGYGRVIKIRHAFGFETIYAHLDATRVKVGDRVARGDRIGDMGRTGRTTGVHLHYEIRLNGKPVNPMRYIEAARNVL